MKLGRRKFVFLGFATLSLGAISFPWFYNINKNKLFSDDLETFLSNYNNLIPTEFFTNTGEQIPEFENEIILMLSNSGLKETISVINEKIKSEYKLGKIRLMKGWIISETEFKILILKNKYV